MKPDDNQEVGRDGEEIEPGDGPVVDEAGSSAGAQPGGAADAGNLQRQVDELKDRLLRSAADYQNYIRRSQQNVTEAREQQLFDVARRLSTVLDHFDRALEVDPAKTTAQSLLQGVQIVRDELLKVLEGFGIRRIEAAPGEEFDPKRHEALMRQKADKVEPGHVAAQFQPGYQLGDKTIRPAQVSVAE